MFRRVGWLLWAAEKEDLIGKTAYGVFLAPPFGEDYTWQNLAFIVGGANLTSRPELHLYPSGKSGGCLTWKKPSNDVGQIICLSCDLADLQQATGLSTRQSIMRVGIEGAQRLLTFTITAD